MYEEWDIVNLSLTKQWTHDPLNDLHSDVPESGSILLAFNFVTQKYGACNYVTNLDQRCQHKNLKCEKQIKEYN
jgi:hypothetical protein